jgi:hypothetical protein
MSWNLNNFRTNVKAIALNQYFMIEIPEVGDVQKITALARTTDLPAMVHETTGVPYRGLDMKIQTKVTFSDWNVTFLCEQDHDLRTKMLTWQAKMYKLDSAANRPHDEYKVDNVSVSKVGYDGAVIPKTTCKFFGLFPSSVGPVSLDQAGGTPDTFDVTFTYDYFVPADGSIAEWSGGASS